MDGRRTNRVLIIGSRGVLGALTVQAFSHAGWQVRSAARGGGPGQIALDLDRPESVLGVLEEDELVINTVPHRELTAERLVLERGGTLINMSALPTAAARGLRAVAGGARGTVLMNAGLAPGITTIVAADLLRRHPEAEELEMVFTLSAAVPRGAASVNFLRRGLTAVGRHRTVAVPLPEPFGERLCMGFREDDAGWIGGIAEGRLVRPYVCVLEPAVHERLVALNGAGAFNRLSDAVIRARPLDGARTPSHEPVAHWIAAIRGDRRLAVSTVRCEGDYAHAARTAVLFAEALRVRPPGGGCFDPEEISTLADLRDGLRDAGISIVPIDLQSRP